MLSLLKIKNIALIDRLDIEFGPGLNLLTGETGSGKSIIVDSLGALTGDRVSSDLIKEGEASAQIEGLFSVPEAAALNTLFDEAGIEIEDEDLIVRRELSHSGKNRVFVNNQLVTQGFLKRLGPYLVDIHGQGEHTTLFSPAYHLDILDEFAGAGLLREKAAEAHHHWSVTKTELGMLEQNEAEKLQMLDILKFQVDEIKRAGIQQGEETELEEEKRRLNNAEKLSTLSDDAYSLLYESDEATTATLEKAARKIEELAEYEPKFAEYMESVKTAQAVLEDLSISVRDFRGHLEFSPERLAEIDDRLAEIARLKRKYGGTVESVLAHLSDSAERLENIETAEWREAELRKKLLELRAGYIAMAGDLHEKRLKAARKFEKEVEANLKAVALEKAKFEVRFESPAESDLAGTNFDKGFSAKGFDAVEFYFSANPGESPKPLVKVASGGEASRLMLVLKTTARAADHEKAVVFDEIDTGIGGRVAEAVGLKLKELSRTQQVLCVTHQAQIASLADKHFIVEKSMARNSTGVSARELEASEKVEEIARMLAGQTITETARQHAREMLSAAG
jgi:DNA repair protein RecN (Recombination protein N)